MPENNVITEEHVKDIYNKFIIYCNKKLNIIDEKSQTQIVEDIKTNIIDARAFTWNETSLTDYLNAIIYMIKGQQFARTINTFSKNYYLQKLNEDFGDTIYENAKKSLELHETYYRDITNKRRLKVAIKNFRDRWDDNNGLWRNEYFQGIRNYKNLKLNASYGIGQRLVMPKIPYMTFLKEEFTTNNGVYPYISYQYNERQFKVGLGVSRDNVPNVNKSIIEQIENYESKFFNTDDLESVVNQINICIDDFFRILKNNESNFVLENTKEIKMNIKNIILYGAPGVGKTHNYKKLISLIEQGKNKNEIFDSMQLNEEFTKEDESFQNVNNEKRIEFVTFHQSFSYEDFIEGFRPQENGNIEIENGIFKLISKNAENQSFQLNTKTINFDEAYDILRDNYFENELEKIYTVSNVEIVIHEFKENTIKLQSSNAKDTQYVKKSDLEIVVKAFIKNEIDKPADIKKLDVKKDTKSLAGFYYPIGKLILKLMRENKVNEEIEKNYYLVIDEINRGNISKIFGELITLIEESKRDTYEITLPYSKQKFSVPSNLYIIGTMNTTDKSIALIDVALRRRFTFIKMEPNSDLVLPSFKNDFEKLNKLITEHIGEDYQIGHSYFMNIDESDLDFVKKYKIKPLLEEYYYGDDRISEALNILGL